MKGASAAQHSPSRSPRPGRACTRSSRGRGPERGCSLRGREPRPPEDPGSLRPGRRPAENQSAVPASGPRARRRAFCAPPPGWDETARAFRSLKSHVIAPARAERSRAGASSLLRTREASGARGPARGRGANVRQGAPVRCEVGGGDCLTGWGPRWPETRQDGEARA